MSPERIAELRDIAEGAAEPGDYHMHADYCRQLSLNLTECLDEIEQLQAQIEDLYVTAEAEGLEWR